MKAKRVLICLVLALAAIFLPCVALADDGMTAEELYIYYEENGYPDDIGGMYIDDDGRYAILLTDNTTERQREIESRLSDGETVSFGSSRYSYNELLSASDAITREMLNGNDDIWGCGVGWHFDGENDVGFGDSGKEFRVVVSVKSDVIDEYREIFSERFGDMIYFEGAEYVYTDETAQNESVTGEEHELELKKEKRTTTLALISIAVCALLLFAFITLRYRVTRDESGKKKLERRRPPRGE